MQQIGLFPISRTSATPSVDSCSSTRVNLSNDALSDELTDILRNSLFGRTSSSAETDFTDKNECDTLFRKFSELFPVLILENLDFRTNGRGSRSARSHRSTRAVCRYRPE